MGLNRSGLSEGEADVIPDLLEPLLEQLRVHQHRRMVRVVVAAAAVLEPGRQPHGRMAGDRRPAQAV